MDFTKVTSYLDSLEKTIGVPATDTMVTLNGECVYRHQTGCRDAAGAVPMNGREVYWVYSMTKPLTCACALRLIQDGKLRLDDAVCEYIPAFSKYPSMTVEHLMSMRGGLDYELDRPAIAALSPDAGTVDVAAALADKPLSFAPGTDFQYSLCHDVLAAVIEIASGMKFGEFMKKTLFAPLGMEHSGFEITDYHRDNMCAEFTMEDGPGIVRGVDNSFNRYVLRPSHESGGAGLITTVEDYMRFASAIACRGGGVISMEMIDIWRGRTLTGKPKSSFDALERTGYNYGLGVRVMVDNSHAKSPLGEFGWDGAAGAYTLMDPDNAVAIVYAQHVLGCGDAYYVIHPALRDLTYEALGM